MFGSITRFAGRLLGTDKAMEAMVDGVASGLDKLVHTSEEKADAAATERSEARKMVVAWMTATQGQNLARRLIALVITAVWLSQYLLAEICILVSVWVPVQVVDKVVQINNWEKSSEVLRGGAADMNGAVMLILAFYFAAPHMSGIAQAVTKKFIGNSKNG